MASLKELRVRIKSVKNTQQITKTMKMVAAAKVRRARSTVDAARPYADRMARVLSNLAANVGDNGPLLLTGRTHVKTVRLVVFGSDRGLCGGFNANLLRQTFNLVADLKAQGKQVEIVAVGRKIRDGVKAQDASLLLESVTDFSKNITFSLAEEIAQKCLTDFETGACDQVVLFYSECESMLTQTPKTHQLIPFKAEVTADASSVEYEPEEEAILAELLPKNLNMQVFKGLLESNASEQAARMTAMDSATRNAGDMIKKLSQEYNRSRQAAITTELVEIIAGAEAL